MAELARKGGEKVFDMKVYDFNRAWRRFMSSMGFNHIPHETRHTFRTLIDATEGNRRCIDMIMGHASGSVGERVYTHKTVAELVATVDLIDFDRIIDC
jgi:integrase